MIYWLIPYLVAYNASDSGNWQYGPEHIFKVEMRVKMGENKRTIYVDIDLYMPCEPINTTLIQCRIESPSVETYIIDADTGSKISAPIMYTENIALESSIFQVDFNENGTYHIRFLNDSTNWTVEIIREIVDTANLNIDLSDMSYENYDLVDNSYIGSCKTKISIGSEIEKGERGWNPEIVIQGYSFDVPLFKRRNSDKPIVINKHRNLNNCVKKSPAFIDAPYAKGVVDKNKTQILSSENRINLGKKSFSAYTINTGHLYASDDVKCGVCEEFVPYFEVLRVNLESIKAAKGKVQNNAI